MALRLSGSVYFYIFVRFSLCSSLYLVLRDKEIVKYWQICQGRCQKKIMTEAVPMVTFFSHVFRVSRARNETEVSASVCLILQATALFVRQATEPASVQSLCHLKNQEIRTTSPGLCKSCLVFTVCRWPHLLAHVVY